MGAGRPSVFTEQLFNEICDKIAYSDRGLVSICKELNINACTFYDWIGKDNELSNKYARARELQADFIADQIIEISNTPVQGTKTKETERGVEVTTGDMIEHRRLQVDARKWKASKLYPKKYGDKVDVTTDGEKITNTPAMIKLSNGTEIAL